MLGKIFLLGLSCFSLGGELEVFENYFDDSIKEVDISQDSAIKACLTNGDTLADKVKAAYGNCFGKDYDFDELAGNDADQDSDNDGLPDSFEENEACFYKEMGWLDASGAAAADVIKTDLTGLEAELKTEFDGHIDACAAWSGSFGSRRKREAVPAVMESGSAALTWLRSAVRKTRSAESGDGKGAKKSSKKDRKGKKKGKKGNKRSGNGGKAKGGKGKGARKSSKKSKKGKNKGKKGNTRSDKGGKAKGGKGARKSSKKGEKGKNKGKKGNTRSNKGGKAKGGKGKGARKSIKKEEKGDKIKKISEEKGGKGNNYKSLKEGKEKNVKLDESTYNKLWCFDLSMEQVLEKCVEQKIKN